MDPRNIFKKYCKKSGMRYTPEREVILEEIYRKDEHFDVDSLLLRIRRKYPKMRVSRASIYRAIPFFIDANLIRESFHENGHACYEHLLGHSHHDHMKCLKCGKIFEFYDKKIDKIQQLICKRYEFKILWHIHVLGGYCHRCQKLKRNLQKNNK